LPSQGKHGIGVELSFWRRRASSEEARGTAPPTRRAPIILEDRKARGVLENLAVVSGGEISRRLCTFCAHEPSRVVTLETEKRRYRRLS
jgi:hypothetical protein